MTGVVAAIVEAWSELRVHKTRILLALIGVALSVAALTSVVALGDMARQGFVESSERSGGREATISLQVSPNGGQLDTDEIRRAYNDVADRYAVKYASLRYQTAVPFQFPDGVRQADTVVVDPDYGAMRRVDMVQGRWFAEDDGERLAPAVVVNERFHAALGAPDLRTHPVVQIAGERSITATIVGVIKDDFLQVPPQAMMLPEHYDRWLPGGPSMAVSMQLWVPPELADPLVASIQAELAAQFPNDNVMVNRTDFAAFGDPLSTMQLAIGGIAGMVLLLGAVGLVNISMVTVRYRVREIGIRRSFGATSGRIFFGIMLESVVATFVAGVVGVMLAVAVLKSPWVVELMAQGLTNVPAFPLEAAVVGIAAATAVGALAGLIPALVAVRVKVIDAIRY
jgi:putative ABC transport system permease protein